MYVRHKLFYELGKKKKKIWKKEKKKKLKKNTNSADSMLGVKKKSPTITRWKNTIIK